MPTKDIIFSDKSGSVELVGCAGSGLDLLDAVEKGGRPSRQAHDEAKDHCVLFFEIRAPMFVVKEHIAHSDWICREVEQEPQEYGFYEPKLYWESRTHGLTRERINPVLRDDVRSGRFRVYRTSKALKIHHEQSLILYKNMIDAGICRQQAATVLPQSTYVLYYASATLADVLNFSNNVTDESLIPELREISASIFTVVAQRFPKTAKAWRRAEKWKRDDLSGRLNKFGSLLAAGERLNNEQVRKIKEVKSYLERRQGDNNADASDEVNISKRGHGSGGSQASKEDRRRWRWRFWKKNTGSS